MIDYTQLARPHKLTRDEFLDECARVSLSTPEHVLEYHEITECSCDAPDCPGWNAVYLVKSKRARRGN